MLVDANILLYSVDESSPSHLPALAWLTAALNGPRRVGIPWMSLTAFVRISTNARATRHPLAPAEAWQCVEGWLDAPASWVPGPGPAHREILAGLLVTHDVRAGLVTDAVLVALCLEYGLEIVSADSDFARFNDVVWVNPLAR